MKPLNSEPHDVEALQDIGRASVQIVHDLKNQIGGLKLYATFLRRRMEKSARPEDELETISKLIAGLDRAALDASLLVRYGRPLELSLHPGTDLAELLKTALAPVSATLLCEPDTYTGEFDRAALTEALKDITDKAFKNGTGTLEVHLRPDQNGGNAPRAIIEWRSDGISKTNDFDSFCSLAGAPALRLALAAKIIRGHGGEIEHEAGAMRVRLPLRKDEG